MSERDMDVLALRVDAMRVRSLAPGDPNETRATKQRILSTLRARRRRKQRLLWGLTCAALVLPLGSTTYAFVYGMPAGLRPLLSRVGLPADTSVRNERARVPKPAIAASAAPNDAGLEPPALPTVQPTSEPSTPPAHRTRAIATRGHSSNRTRASSARSQMAAHQDLGSADAGDSAESLSTRLYAHAHELHFVARDAESALRAWDTYLTHAPLTVLRTEAEYNRALCLVRVGRDEEALRALAPFATGKHGAYRRREAAGLVNALHHRGQTRAVHP
jgi:hypothetical protein